MYRDRPAQALVVTQHQALRARFARVALGIAHVPENRRLFPRMTV